MIKNDDKKWYIIIFIYVILDYNKNDLRLNIIFTRNTI